jgi:hypothetical protein
MINNINEKLRIFSNNNTPKTWLDDCKDDMNRGNCVTDKNRNKLIFGPRIVIKNSERLVATL